LASHPSPGVPPAELGKYGCPWEVLKYNSCIGSRSQEFEKVVTENWWYWCVLYLLGYVIDSLGLQLSQWKSNTFDEGVRKLKAMVCSQYHLSHSLLLTLV
jgi:hypothetical protein